MSFYGNILTRVKDAYIKIFRITTGEGTAEWQATEIPSAGESNSHAVEISIIGQNGISTSISDDKNIIIDGSIIEDGNGNITIKDKLIKQQQNQVEATGTEKQTITKITQDENGEITVKYSNIAFPQGLTAKVENGYLVLTTNNS